MDLTSEVLEIDFSISPPYFRMATYGYAGNTQVDHTHTHTFHTMCLSHSYINIHFLYDKLFICLSVPKFDFPRDSDMIEVFEVTAKQTNK